MAAITQQTARDEDFDHLGRKDNRHIELMDVGMLNSCAMAPSTNITSTPPSDTQVVKMIKGLQSSIGKLSQEVSIIHNRQNYNIAMHLPPPQQPPQQRQYPASNTWTRPSFLPNPRQRSHVRPVPSNVTPYEWSSDGRPICQLCGTIGHMRRRCPQNFSPATENY